MWNLDKDELRLLRTLRTPSKIQDFVNALHANFETRGDTCMSPRLVLRTRKAHCIEGAMLAALALRVQGHPPLLLDLTTTAEDADHVVALFKTKGLWGAISKTNHAVLRYREPIYRTIREIAMSYFHEYFLENGKKTMRSYSLPFNLATLDHRGWATSEENVWFVAHALDDARHFPVLPTHLIRTLRKADTIERKAGSIVEWKKRKYK